LGERRESEKWVRIKKSISVDKWEKNEGENECTSLSVPNRVQFHSLKKKRGEGGKKKRNQRNRRNRWNQHDKTERGKDEKEDKRFPHPPKKKPCFKNSKRAKKTNEAEGDWSLMERKKNRLSPVSNPHTGGRPGKKAEKKRKGKRRR